MKLLFLHTDYLEFQAKQKTRVAEDVAEEDRVARAEDALAVFIAAEKADEKHTSSVVESAVENIEQVYTKVGATQLVLYPYAHLSTSLARPRVAVEAMKKMEEALREKGYRVLRAPFGWYKAFELRCKGHPLSELSREISVEREKRESRALEAEKELEKSWYVLSPDGELVPVEKFNFSGHSSLKTFYEYETSGSRAVGREPPHIRLMKKLQLVDYEPASDPGNLRWYPKGALIKMLLEEHVSGMVRDYGAMQVETPILYDYAHEKLSKYLHRFPARQYVVRSDDYEYFLRFAACFGQYLMMHDLTASYRQLPLKLYELTHYSFRREQSGELAGLKRLRTFTMPDMHSLCRDMAQAKEEFLKQFKLSMQWMEDIELDYDVAIRSVRDYFDENRDFLTELARLVGKPILIEVWEERFFYFIMKFEFSVNDALNNAATLSTVQIDVENTQRFDITYTDESGEAKYPLLLHASPSGGIDRNLYALLEAEYIRAKKGQKPTLPTWLSPTQVRIIPVSEKNIGYAEELLEFFRQNMVRADMDDEGDTLGKKIRKAESEWIPYIAVVGVREEEERVLNVRVRAAGEKVKLSREELAQRVEEETQGKPFAGLPLPERLSLRPSFRG